MTPAATILIATKNRKDELAGAVASALAQTAPVEVLVIDDGSTDGTAEFVRQRFPAARLVRHDQSAGYIVRRNQGAEAASAPVVVSIDDDAAFPSPRTVEQTLAEFDHPRIGAVAVPFIDVRHGPAVRQQAPPGAGAFVAASYIGTAHAVRRDLFARLGGYRPVLFHQGEEGDYCVRLLAAGYVVWLGRADPIHHFESPKRDFTRWDVYGRRNDVLFGWHNAPAAALPVQWAGTVLNGLRHGLRVRRPGNMVRGLAEGFAAVLGPARRGRAPVPADVYRLFRELKTGGPQPLEAVLGRLPPAVA